MSISPPLSVSSSWNIPASKAKSSEARALLIAANRLSLTVTGRPSSIARGNERNEECRLKSFQRDSVIPPYRTVAFLFPSVSGSNYLFVLSFMLICPYSCSKFQQNIPSNRGRCLVRRVNPTCNCGYRH